MSPWFSIQLHPILQLQMLLITRKNMKKISPILLQMPLQSRKEISQRGRLKARAERHWLHSIRTLNLGPVHTASFLLVSFFVARKLPVNIAPFLLTGNIRFCPFASIHLITKNGAKNIRFLCVHIAKSEMKSVLLNIGAFSKTSVLLRSH